MKRSAWLAMLTVASISTGVRADPEDAPVPPTIPAVEDMQDIAEPVGVVIDDETMTDEVFESKPEWVESNEIEPVEIKPTVIEDEESVVPTIEEPEPLIYLTSVVEDKNSEETQEEWVSEDIWPMVRSDDPVPLEWMAMTTTVGGPLSETYPPSMQSPEPASLTLLGLGLASMAVYRRRRLNG